jgi:hypothetical protein
MKIDDTKNAVVGERVLRREFTAAGSRTGSAALSPAALKNASKIRSSAASIDAGLMSGRTKVSTNSSS